MLAHATNHALRAAGARPVTRRAPGGAVTLCFEVAGDRANPVELAEGFEVVGGVKDGLIAAGDDGVEP